MSSEENNKAKRNWFLHVISDHPFGTVVIFVAALCSIIAVGPALFPWWTAPKRKLTYCVNPIRTPIIQSSKSTDVAVTYRGTRIEGNLTAAQIAIWNAGRETIKREHILSPIILRTDNCRIFDVIISKTNAVNEFRFNFESNDVAAAKIVMDWRILEKDEGALVQIVYAGPPEVPITLEGRIEGQKLPHYVKLGKPLNGLIWLLSLSFAVNIVDKISNTIRPSTLKTRRIILFVIGSLLFIGGILSVWILWPFQTNKTPFGF